MRARIHTCFQHIIPHTGAHLMQNKKQEKEARGHDGIRSYKHTRECDHDGTFKQEDDSRVLCDLPNLNKKKSHTHGEAWNKAALSYFRIEMWRMCVCVCMRLCTQLLFCPQRSPLLGNYSDWREMELMRASTQPLVQSPHTHILSFSFPPLSDALKADSPFTF